jgi:hypothetical protein
VRWVLAPVGFSKKSAARRVLFSFSGQRKKSLMVVRFAVWDYHDSGKGTEKALPLLCPLFPSRTKIGSIGKDARLRSHRGKQ